MRVPNGWPPAGHSGVPAEPRNRPIVRVVKYFGGPRALAVCPPGQASGVQPAHSVPLRIQTRVGKAENSLVLDGWLTGPEVAEFERVACSLTIPLRIDLAHVTGADSAGVAALHAQRTRGAALANASPYIELLLHAYLGTSPDNPCGQRKD